MKIDVIYGFPFVSVTICYSNKVLLLKRVLLDTGSAGTVFNADVVDEIGVRVEPEELPGFFFLKELNTRHRRQGKPTYSSRFSLVCVMS